MITVLFVHGTGVRVDSYKATLESIEERLKFPEFPNLQVVGVPWGDQYGSRRASKSIFRHTETGAEEYTSEDAQSDMWRVLAADPMAALRFVALNRPVYAGGKPGAQKPDLTLDHALDSLLLPDRYDALQPVLFRSGIEHLFPEACQIVKSDEAYERFKEVAAPPLDPFYDALADTLVALSISMAIARHGASPFVGLDENLRVELTSAIRGKLGDVSASMIGDWAKKLGSKALGAAAYAGSFVAVTPYIEWHRGPFSDSASPVAGDILLYQCRGKKIRDLIRTRVEDFIRDDVVLLAHSLGGVACVDLLLDKSTPDFRKRVKLLITVGSQSPYFYEINALRSLRYRKDPKALSSAFQDFPPWVNLHNRRDFLSYVGSDVFPAVMDLEVHSRLPFPQSHTSYFTRPETYAHVKTGLELAFGKAASR